MRQSPSRECVPKPPAALQEAYPSGAVRQALDTVLAWRKAPTLAVDPATQTTVSSNTTGMGRQDESQESSCTQTTFTSRAIELGGLPIQIVARLASEGDEQKSLPPEITYAALSTMVEAHFALWYVWDLPTGLCSFPGQFEELLGMQANDAPRCIEEWLNLVHPEDLNTVIADNDRAIRERRPYRGEYRLRRANGTYVSVCDWGTVLCERDGTAERMVGGIRDITAEKALHSAVHESAELHRALFQKALMPAVRIDAKGVFLDANEAALNFLELQESALIGRMATNILPSQVVERVQEALRDMRSFQGEPAVLEIEILVGGRPKWLLMTIVPYDGQDGPMAFLLGADLTEHEKMSDALAESEKALRERTKALEEHNVALRVLIEQRQRDVDELSSVLTDNLEQLVSPLVERLAQALVGRPEAGIVESMRHTLGEVMRPLLRRHDTPGESVPTLTRREHEILQLIRAGKTTEDIARLLYLSPTTVTFHRGNIRRKLGMYGSHQRLAPKILVSSVYRPGAQTIDGVSSPTSTTAMTSGQTNGEEGSDGKSESYA